MNKVTAEEIIYIQMVRDMKNELERIRHTITGIGTIVIAILAIQWVV